MNWLTNTANNAVKILDDNKGTILMIAGLTAGAAGTVCACKATLKAEDIVDNFKHNKEEIKAAGDICPEYRGSDTEKQHIVNNYVSTGVEITKAYAPAMILGGAAVAGIVGSHCIMQSKVNNLEKAVASISAAYVAVDSAFKKYRKRVVDKYGEEEDMKLRYGVDEETLETTNEKGKKVKEKKEIIKDWNPDDISKIFDGNLGSGKGFIMFKDPNCYHVDWNATIRQLQLAEGYLNDQLIAKGYLFLNDAYKELCIKETIAGQSLGWVYDPNKEYKIDLGLSNAVTRRVVVNGEEEDCILLTFNVDGVILDRVGLASK